MRQSKDSPPACRAAAWLLPGLLLWTQITLGHVVYGRVTVSQLTAGADLVAVARITNPRAVATAAEGKSRPAVEAVVTEVLKGKREVGTLRFAVHGHGTVDYVRGQEVLLFLLDAGRSPELAAFAREAGLDYVSLREHETGFDLARGDTQQLLAAVASYARLGETSDPELRAESLWAITIDLLRSDEAVLVASAAMDLALAGDTGPFTRDRADELLALTHDAEVLAGARVAVLAELARRRWVDAGEHWARLLEEVSGPDRRQVIRAAGAHPAEPVAKALLRILEKDTAMVAEAAIALGWPGNDLAVPALERLLKSGDRSARMAAIRGLERIDTDESRACLREAARAHTDPDTRRRAAAGLR